MLHRIAPILILCACASSASADVSIHCLSVGQADATLVVSSSGKTLLFDGGENGDGSGVIIPYMNSIGIDTLHYMAASHYHADHIGGLDEVYHQFGVAEAVYDRGWTYTTTTYTSYAQAVSPKRQTVGDGFVIDLGDDVTATVVAINGNGQEPSPFDDSGLENEYCMALLIECGDFDFFVAGDLTGGYGAYDDIETSVGPEVGDIEVYRVSHHGSYSSSNTSFMNATTPEVSIISVPVSSSYGHPHQDALDRISAVGSYVYQTAQGSDSTYPDGMRTIVNGHIVITSDGYGEYFVDGDSWMNDEPDLTDVVPDAGGLIVLGNAPNPFNPSTEIRFETSEGGDVRLSVYDVAGRLIVDATVAARPGLSTWRWDGRDAAGRATPSGVYLYRLIGREGAGSGRMTLVR